MGGAADTQSVHLSLDEVHDLALAALVGCGASPVNAAPVARSIREAEADGLRNIGLGYLPIYCGHLLCGKVDGRATPEVTQTAPGALAVDARQGFAHPAIAAGLERLAPLVRQQGIAAMGVGNSYACGVLGHLVEPLARQGLLALVFANAPAIIAPWGGKRPIFGTNPLAVVIPRTDRDPVIIDQSSSVTAKVSIFQRQAEGRPLEPGWALDRDGNPTLDPGEAVAGSMLPAGGYKGAGLALLVEIMAAGLTGANWSFTASPFADNSGGPPRVGQFFLALDPTRFGGPDFLTRVEELLGAILDQEGTRLPGDQRLGARSRTATQGVTLDPALHGRLLGFTQGQA